MHSDIDPRELIIRQVLADAKKSTAEYENRIPSTPKLRPHSVGECNKCALMTALAGFDGYTHLAPDPITSIQAMEKMRSGRIWEDINATALAGVYTHKYPLENEHWLGEADFVSLEHGIVIERKDVSEWAFKYAGKPGDNIPHKGHCIQASVYARLLGQQIGKQVTAYLYYNGRGHHAYIMLSPTEDTIKFHGNSDSNNMEGEIDYNLQESMLTLESLLDSRTIPEGENDPLGCCSYGNARNGYWPKCPWFSTCWPGLNRPFFDGEWTATDEE